MNTPAPAPAPAAPAPAAWSAARNLRLAARLDAINVEPGHGRGLIREGVLRRAVGLTLEAVGCEAPMAPPARSRSTAAGSTPKWSASPATAPT